MKKLLVDLDYVICINQMVPKINEFFGTDYTNENFPSLKLSDVFTDSEQLETFLDSIKFENFYKNPNLFADVKRVLKQLSKYYEICITTAYVWPNHPENTKTELCSKLDFLYKTFDFIDKKNIIFCSNKKLLCGDVIIDDKVENLKGPSKVKLLYTSIYNKNTPNSVLEKDNITRINNWQEIKNLLMKIK